jgi:hypothetical protein
MSKKNQVTEVEPIEVTQTGEEQTETFAKVMKAVDGNQLSLETLDQQPQWNFVEETSLYHEWQTGEVVNCEVIAIEDFEVPDKVTGEVKNIEVVRFITTTGEMKVNGGAVMVSTCKSIEAKHGLPFYARIIVGEKKKSNKGTFYDNIRIFRADLGIVN